MKRGRKVVVTKASLVAGFQPGCLLSTEFPGDGAISHVSDSVDGMARQVLAVWPEGCGGDEKEVIVEVGGP
jgi:hypothetical protein